MAETVGDTRDVSPVSVLVGRQLRPARMSTDSILQGTSDSPPCPDRHSCVEISSERLLCVVCGNQGY